MSQDITSILLPSSRVDFFALDDGTAATAQKLAADWRFARVEVQINREGIEAAINAYGQQASPELIIIETDDISEAFLAQLGGLAGVCAAGTDAVIVGPMNDVHLYRNLVGMGVKDYLVRPVSENDLINVIAKALVEKRGLGNSRLVTVIGSKGGVGTTTVSQLLSWTIAQSLEQKTVLLDAAGSSGSLGIAYGLEPTTSLTEAVRVCAAGSDDDMKRIVQPATDNLSLLVCGGDAMLNDSPDADGIEGVVNRFMQKSPVVVMDLSGATQSVQKRMLARSSRVVLVTTPLLSALRNSRTLLGEIKNLRGGLKDVDLIVNMHGHAGHEEVPLADIKAALDKEADAKIAYLPKLFIGSEATGKPAGEGKGAAEIIGGLLGIAARAAGTEAKTVSDGGKKEGPLGFLKGLTKAKRG